VESKQINHYLLRAFSIKHFRHNW